MRRLPTLAAAAALLAQFAAAAQAAENSAVIEPQAPRNQLRQLQQVS